MKSSMCCLGSVLLLAGVASGAAEWRHGERQDLWPSVKQIPDFRAHQIGAMTDEVNESGFKKEEHRMPYLEWFEKPANPNGECMILVSGGSYCCCCDVNLIRTWRDALTARGFQTVNLVYRTPPPNDNLEFYRSGWQDGQRAVRLVRSQAAARGFSPEKIGVIGMSAGGHLVTMLATSALTASYERIDALDDLPCHVNWCIANAPAYNTATCGSGARPEDGTFFMDLKPNPSFRFDAKTCPISFHHGAVDGYTPNGSTQCYRALRKLGVPTELHLYADRGHGAFGLDCALEFLTQMNFDGKLGSETERCVFTGTNTAERIVEKLWPDGRYPQYDAAQISNGVPTVEWFIPKTLRSKAIQIVTPGGAYMHCNVSGEGLPVAEYFNAKGMTVVVLKYRCPRPKNMAKYVPAWADAQRAVRLVRSEAASRGLDPDRIGVMGFSAGGHLTLLTALSSTYPAYSPVDDLDRKVSCKVQWACPIYPAYVLTDGVDDGNKTRGNGEDVRIVSEFLFDVNTPPMCLIHGDADQYSAMGSVQVWERLRHMGASSDLHTLATRGHCFQFKAADGTGSANWLDRIWDFLSRKGFNKAVK